MNLEELGIPNKSKIIQEDKLEANNQEFAELLEPPIKKRNGSIHIQKSCATEW